MSLVKHELMVIPGFNDGEHISISVGAKLSPLPGEPGGVTDSHWVGESSGRGVTGYVTGHPTASVRHSTEIAQVRYTFSVDAERIGGSWRVDHDFRREPGKGGKTRAVTIKAANLSREKIQEIIDNLRDSEVRDRINEIAGWDARRQMIEHRERLREAVASMVVIEHEHKRESIGIEGKWER